MKREFPNLTVIDHPLIQTKLTRLRNQETTTDDFRRLVREMSHMLAYEVTRDLPTELVKVTTPVAETSAPIIAGKKPCIVSILRAGNGMLDGMLELLPTASVGFIGLYRDPATLEPIEYYLKLPVDISDRMVIVVDPMLATGNSSAAAIHRVKEQGVTTIKLVNILAAPEGVQCMLEEHPDVPVTVAALDEKLNEHGYIVPGLGDAGDRIFGTR